MEHCPGFKENQLLARLGSATRERLERHMKLKKVTVGESLYGPDATYHDWVYFPLDAIVSHVYTMKDGRSAEISLVGCEGMVGVGFAMGGEARHSQALVQHASGLCALPSKALKDELEINAELRDLFLRYIQMQMVQTAQTAACNCYHRIEQRLCRWLLLALDRLPDENLNMTQEIIAMMLGVRREGVTECAGQLQQKGAITYRRGHIHVVDRALLEDLCCECYAVVEDERERLLPAVRRNDHA